MSTYDAAADIAEYTQLSLRRKNWRTATGFSLDKERYLDSFARRRYLRSLAIIVESRIEKAYDAKEADLLEGTFTPFWTPVPGICVDLEIAPTHLNRLLKEYSGMTAQMMCERQRCYALELDEKLADEIAKFIRARFVPGATSLSSGERADVCNHTPGESFCCGVGVPPAADSELDLRAQHLEFWRAWREHRKSTPGWDNATWAAQYGFTSYAKFHRAFTLAFGKSPIQYESQTMHEAALYFRAMHSLARRHKNGGTYPTNQGSIDHYVQLRSENAVWWNSQRERYGLSIELHDLAQELDKEAAQFKEEPTSEEPPTVCTHETKNENQLPSTPANNPWPPREASPPSSSPHAEEHNSERFEPALAMLATG